MKATTRHLLPRALLLTGILALNVRAQTPDLTAIVEQLNALRAEVGAVKAENAALREQLGHVEQKVAHPVAAAPVPTVTDVRDRYPQIEFHLLGDITYNRSNETGAHNTFALGDLDPVVTAKLTDHSSALGDFVIAANHGDFAFETERLLLQYKVNDSLNVSVGRFHTMIGYYNNTYHNGTYFQTTVDRPAIYDFEDNGGILPIHSNGVSVDGDIPSGSLRLHYVAEVANGRDYSPGAAPFAIEDTNGQKAFNLALFARPEALPGLQVGGSVYRDAVSPDGLARVNQTVFSAYAVYKNRSFEWLNEFVALRDAVRDDRTYSTDDFYTQVSRKFGAFRPYLRLEWRSTAAGDPLIALLDQHDTFRTQTVGLRYDFTPMMGLKAEMERNIFGHSASVTASTMQLTFRY